MNDFLRNNKIYIEFFGLGGSGKTSICNSLTEQIEKKGYDAISVQKEFIKHGRLYRHVIPVIYTILKLKFLILKFLFYVWFNFTIERWGIVKVFFRNQFFVRTYSENYILLLDEGFIKSELNPEKICELLKFYPKNRDKFFIFVDVPLQTAIGRSAKRSFIEKAKKVKLLKGKKLEKKKKYHNELKKAFCLLKEQEGKMQIKKVIRIDGEKLIEENIKFLAKQLNMFIKHENIN